MRKIIKLMSQATVVLLMVGLVVVSSDDSGQKSMILGELAWAAEAAAQQTAAEKVAAKKRTAADLARQAFHEANKALEENTKAIADQKAAISKLKADIQTAIGHQETNSIQQNIDDAKNKLKGFKNATQGLQTEKDATQKSYIASDKKANKAEGKVILERLKEMNNEAGSFDVSNLQVGNEASLTILDDPDNKTNVFNKITTLILSLLGTVAVLCLVVAGYYLIFSQGQESIVTKGKDIVIYVLVGLVIAFCSYIIISFVLSIFFSA